MVYPWAFCCAGLRLAQFCLDKVAFSNFAVHRPQLQER